MSMVLLYDKNFEFGRFFLKIFLSCLIGLPIIIIKKFLSLYNLVYEMYSLYLQNNHNKKRKYSNNSINLNKQNSNDYLYNESEEIIKNKISFYAKRVKFRTLIYTIFGSIFLLINCIFITSYCGIYSNSILSLFLNIIINTIISFIFIFIFRSIGVALRYYGLINKNKSMFNASRFFNILNLTYDDFKEIISNNKKDQQKNS